MATFVFSSAADKNGSEFKGGSAPAGVGARFTIGVSSGELIIGTGWEGIIITQASFQCSGYSGNYNLYGNLWNSSGDSIRTSDPVAGGVDTSSPFGVKTFNFLDMFLPAGTYFVGFSRLTGDWMAWDYNSDNPYLTRYTSVFGASPDGLNSIYGKTLIGSFNYVLYDKGTLSWSPSQVGDRTARVTWGAGGAGSLGKDISIDWGDGGADTNYTVAAGGVPITKDHTYATPGTRTITTTISYSDSRVGIPDLTIAHSFTTTTVPGAPSLAVTPGAYAVTATYSAPASDGGSAITGYEYSTDNATWHTAPSSPFNVSIAAGSTQSVYLRALNQWGSGAEVSGSATAYGVPGAPGVSAVSGVGKITVTYTPPGSNGGESIDYYQYSKDVQQTWTTVPSNPFDVTGPNGVGIGVYVRAVNAAGPGTSAYAYAGPYTVPDAPTITAPTAGSVSDWAEQIYGTWTPNGNGGSAITRYEYSFDGTNYYNLGAVTSAYFTTLARHTSYTLRIRAVNAAGAGAAASVTVTTGGGRFYKYNGSGWDKRFVKIGTGSMPTDAPLKFWNGSAWIYTNV